jgi:hypothetical protein
MNIESIIGLIVIFAALAFLMGLVWWSGRTINRIDRIGPSSVRKIYQSLREERDIG